MNYGYVLKLSQQNVIVTVYDGLHEMDKNQIELTGVIISTSLYILIHEHIVTTLMAYILWQLASILQ